MPLNSSTAQNCYLPCILHAAAPSEAVSSFCFQTLLRVFLFPGPTFLEQRQGELYAWGRGKGAVKGCVTAPVSVMQSQLLLPSLLMASLRPRVVGAMAAVGTSLPASPAARNSTENCAEHT